jgi:hypothetical protein
MDKTREAQSISRPRSSIIAGGVASRLNSHHRDWWTEINELSEHSDRSLDG